MHISIQRYIGLLWFLQTCIHDEIICMWFIQACIYRCTPKSVYIHMQKLLYFEWSPPWHLYILLYKCHGEVNTFPCAHKRLPQVIFSAQNWKSRRSWKPPHLRDLAQSHISNTAESDKHAKSCRCSSWHKAKSPAWATIAAPYLTHWSQFPCSRLSTHSPCISLATRLEDSNGSQPPCPQSSARAHTAAIFELRPGMQLLSCSPWFNSEAVLLLDPSCSKPLSAIITNFSYVWTAQRSTCTKPAQLDKMHDSTSDMSSDTLSDIIFLTFYLTFYLILYLQ